MVYPHRGYPSRYPARLSIDGEVLQSSRFPWRGYVRISDERALSRVIRIPNDHRINHTHLLVFFRAQWSGTMSGITASGESVSERRATTEATPVVPVLDEHGDEVLCRVPASIDSGRTSGFAPPNNSDRGDHDHSYDPPPDKFAPSVTAMNGVLRIGARKILEPSDLPPAPTYEHQYIRFRTLLRQNGGSTRDALWTMQKPRMLTAFSVFFLATFCNVSKAFCLQFFLEALADLRGTEGQDAHAARADARADARSRAWFWGLALPSCQLFVVLLTILTDRIMVRVGLECRSLMAFLVVDVTVEQTVLEQSGLVHNHPHSSKLKFFMGKSGRERVLGEMS